MSQCLWCVIPRTLRPATDTRLSVWRAPTAAGLRQNRFMTGEKKRPDPEQDPVDRPGRIRRTARALSKVALGAALVGAGVGHLTNLRQEFQAQVPDWVPLDPDDVVVWSGYAEIALGAATLLTWRQPARARVGRLGAVFFLAVFPGNVAQWLERKDGFGLDTDQKRMARLAFQPLLVCWALHAGDTRRERKQRRLDKEG
jgi:uncharacterized membrane protein